MAEDRDLNYFCHTLLEDCRHSFHSVDDIDSCPLVPGVCRGIRVSVVGKVFRIFEIFLKRRRMFHFTLLVYLVILGFNRLIKLRWLHVSDMQLLKFI